MRYPDRDSIGGERAFKMCKVEAMESRTLLSGVPMWHEGFHPLGDFGAHPPAHVVAPFGRGGAEHWQPQDAASYSTSQTTEVFITDNGIVVTVSDSDGSADPARHNSGKSLRSAPDAAIFGGYGLIIRDDRGGRSYADFFRGTRNDANTPRDASAGETAGRNLQSVGPAVLETQVSNTAANPGSAPRAATAAVAKAIFSTEQLISQAPAARGASVNPVSSQTVTPILSTSESAGRSVMLYLSLLTNNVRPELLQAKAAAAATALAKTVVDAAEEGAQAAIASAVSGGLQSANRAIEISRLGSPLMLIADSIGSFIQESAQIPTLTDSHRQGPRRAWIVTAAVIAADVVLLSYCYVKRRKSSPALCDSYL